MKLLSSKKILITYFIICGVALILKITGYSFTLRAINFIFIAIVFVYPIVRLFMARFRLWLKILVAFVIISLGFFVANDFLILIAFSSESKREIASWQLGHQEVILTERQGWAGPPYLQYDLIDLRFFGLLNKSIAYGYPNMHSSDTCTIEFKNGYNDKTLYEFDKCKRSLMKINSNSR